jgi:hypothetical protein
MKSLNSDGQQLLYQQNKQIPLISNQGTQNKVNLIYGIGIPGQQKVFIGHSSTKIHMIIITYIVNMLHVK